jgi:glycosyltransferase involved in cell wall biosynthesis
MTRPAAAEPRVALVHDWLTGMRGGERVLEAVCELFPGAPLYTLVHVPGSVSPALEARRPRASVLSRLPGVSRYYRYCLPVFPFAIEQFDLDEVDLVISTSHCAAKSVVRPGRARHLCYCHTPMRYVWDQFPAYFGPQRVGALAHQALRPVLAWLARWDRSTANRVDRFVANSHYVADRIRRYYNRASTVVYPPVDTSFYSPGGRERDRYFLMVTALSPYKRIDLALEAARAVGVPLKIVGFGPERARLEALAGPDVEFLGRQSDAEILQLYRRAAGVLQTSEEDFGIVPVEAQACGRPVVAFARGGASETVRHGVTGVLVEEQTAGAFADGLARALATRFDDGVIRAHAMAFSRERFAAEFRALAAETLARA